MPGGAPFGNQNNRKGKLWQQAIDRALKKRGKGSMIAALDDLAEKFLSAVEKGEKDFVPGYSMLADRLDGKPKQEIAGDINLHGLADIIGSIGEGAGEDQKVET